MKNAFSNNNRCALLFSFLFLLCLIFPYQSNAQTITENSPLTFGKVVIVDNNSPHRIELLESGGFTSDSQYIFFTDPQPANVTADGYPPLTLLNVMITDTNLNRSGGGPAFFSISDVFTNPDIVITDLSGSATFDVGATLSSNGNGAGFTNNKYEGNYTVTIIP